MQLNYGSNDPQPGVRPARTPRRSRRNDLRRLLFERFEDRRMLAVIDLATLSAAQGSTIRGVNAGDYSGHSVSAAGDFNGDGFEDVIVGAYTADGANNAKANAGESYLIFGSAAPTATVDLSNLGSGGMVIYGVDANDLAGVSVSSAGDVNGDGYGDVIIGARDAETVGFNRGESYILFGSATPPATLDLGALGSSGVKILGVDSSDRSGTTVSYAGDVNGDGFDDVLIGAQDAGASGNTKPSAGDSYLVFGASNLPEVLELASLGAKGVTIFGADANDRSGHALSAAGDVNGDGFGDFLIGARFGDAADNAKSSAGESYLIFGKSTMPQQIDLSNLSAHGVSIFGAEANDYSGYSVSGAGDVNGDGFDDFLIGATGADAPTNNRSKAGETYLIYGKAAFPTSIDLGTLSSAGVVFYGADAYDESGVSVSSAGDVNGDGLDDFLIAAWRADGVGNTRGAAGDSHLVFGSTTFPSSFDLASITTSSTNGVTAIGTGFYDLSGFSLSNAGDINGDGFDDLLIGAEKVTRNSKSQAGESYLIFGGNGFTSSVSHLGTASSETITGTPGADAIVGGRGNDLLLGNGSFDILSGGQGNDVLAVLDLNFKRIVGGTGSDTLRLDGAGLWFDMTNLADNRIQGIEQIDISGSGGNTLVLNLRKVLNISDESNTLIVHGNSGDFLVLDAGWTVVNQETINSLPYRVMTNGAATLKVANDVVAPPASTLDLVSVAGPTFGTVPGNASSGNPQISDDGRYVAYDSTASNLVVGDTRTFAPTDVFVRDMTTGVTTLVSNDSSGNEANHSSFSHAISGNGQFVAFMSNASNLVAGDTNSTQDVFVKNLQSGVTTRVSTSSTGSQGNSSSGSPSLSDDGRYVAFQSFANNLVAGDTNNSADIFVKDLLTGTITRVSTDSNSAQSTTHSFNPEISGNGTVVIFRSDATNLVDGDTNGQGDVFAKDLITGVTSRISLDSVGVQGNNFSGDARISSNGRFVVFSSNSTNFLSSDRNLTSTDVFLKDRQTGALVLVSANGAGLQSAATSTPGSVSDDGRFVTFSSTSNEMASNDTNAVIKVFVKDMQTGAVTRISQSSAGFVGNGDSTSSRISGDGQWIVFQSTATNLNPLDTVNTQDVYRAAFSVPASLGVTSDSSGNWTITDTDSVGKNNSLTLSRIGSDFVVTSNGESFPGGANTLTIPQAALTGSLTINAAGGNDTLTLDYAGGNPIPIGGLAFIGGASSNDQLLVVGANLSSMTYNATQAGSGNLNLAGASLNFTGVESLDLTGSTLQSLTVYVDPQSQTSGDIASSIAPHTTTTQTQISFTQSLTSLLVGSVTDTFTLLGETGSNDTFNLSGAGTSLTASVSIQGQGGVDVVEFNADWILPANKNFSASTHSFNLNANADLVTQGTGTVTLVADEVELNSTGSISSIQPVTVRPLADGRSIDIGTNTAGSLSLTNAELGRISSNKTVGSALSGAINVSSAITLAGQSLRLVTGSGVSGTGTITNGHATASSEVIIDQLGESTFSGLLGGPSAGTSAEKNLAVRKAGSGTLILSAANTHTGLTTVDAGVLRITHASALGSASSGTFVADGASLQLQNTTHVTSEPLTIRGSGVNAGGALRNASNNNSWSGPITLAAATTITDPFDNLTVKNVDNSGFLLTYHVASVSYLSGSLSGSGGLTKTGNGQLLLGGANTYGGVTNILAGSINLGGPATLGSTDSGTIVANGATLAILTTTPVHENITASGIGAYTFGAVSGTDGSQLVGNLTLAGYTRIAKFNTGAPFVISGNISDGGMGYGIEVRGSDTPRAITLAGTNTYTGPTELIEPVTLNVNGSLTSDVSLVSGARLGGNGIIYGDVTSTGTGAVNPGVSGVGRLTVVGTYLANTIFDIQDDYLTAGLGGDYDQLVVQGSGNLVNISSRTVTFQSVGGGTVPVRPEFLTLIKNETSSAMLPFSNLAANAPVTLGTDALARTFQSSYVGGSGRDLILYGGPFNQRPSVQGGSFNVLEDTVRVVTASDIGFSDADPSDSLQSVTLTSVPNLGQLYLDLNGNSSFDSPTETLSAGSIISAAQLNEGRLRYLPPLEAFGFSFSNFGFRASDGLLNSNASGFTIHVASVNDAPSFVGGGDQTVAEDAGLQSINAWATSLSKGPANESTQTLTFQVVSNSNPQLFSTAPAISPSGVLTYTSALNAFGTAIIGVRLQDSGGTADGGVNTSPIQTFTITVSPSVDDASDILLSNNTISESATVGSAIGNFSIAGGGAATFALVSGELDNSLFGLTGNTLQLSSTLDYETRTTYSVRMRTTVGASTFTSDYLILVTPENEFAPTLTSTLGYSVVENSTLVGTLTASDADLPAPQFIYSIAGGADETRFTLQGSVLSFATAPNFEAPTDTNADNNYLVRVAISDGQRIGHADLTVSVTNTNDAPTNISISNDWFGESSPVGTLIGVLTADDEDGDSTLTFEFATNDPSTNTNFMLVGNELRTRREFDFETPADRALSISVVAFDAQRRSSAPATINLILTDAPDRAVANNQTLSTNRNSPLPITLTGHDGNGGSGVSYDIVQQPAFGQLTGTLPDITYVPNIGFTGTDEFYFTTFNGSFISFQARVEITVIGTTPTISFSTGAGTHSENSGNHSLTLNLSETTNVDLSVLIEVGPYSTAEAGVDFFVPTYAIIPAGQSSTQFSVFINDDQLDEVDETAQIGIGPSWLYLAGSQPNFALTIVDDDAPPVFQLTDRSQVVTESNQTILVPLPLSAPTTNALTIPVTISGTALAVQDINPIASTIVFAVGDQTGYLAIPVRDDIVVDGVKTVVIDFGGPAEMWPENASAADRRFTLTIRDNDLPSVELLTSLASISENASSYTLTAKLSTILTEPLRVPVSFAGTAQRGGALADYFSPTSEFVFQPGHDEATLTLQIVDDSAIELAEQLRVDLQNGVGYGLGGRRSFVGTIQDNDFATVDFSVSKLEVWEGSGTQQIVARLSKPVPQQVSVTVQTSSAGTQYAEKNVDYTFSSTTFVFAPNSPDPLIATRTISILDDTRTEENETVQITMVSTSDPSVRLGSQKSYSLIIKDDDPLVSIRRLASSVTESNSSKAQFEVRLSKATNRDVVANLSLSGSATAGQDYVALTSNNVTIPGDTTTTSKIVALNIKDDNLGELPETITASLSSVSRGNIDSTLKSASIDIQDNETPTIKIDTADGNVAEQPLKLSNGRVQTRVVTVTVSVTSPVSRDLLVPIQLSGDAVLNTHYRTSGLGSGQTLLIPKEKSSASFTLEIIDNSKYEGNKVIVVKATGVNAPAKLPATGLVRKFTIIDDERKSSPAPAKSASQSNIPISTGTVLLGDYGPLLGPLTNTSTGLSNVQICLPSGAIGSLAVCSTSNMAGSNGPLDGAIAFFDMNFNGVLDFVDLDHNSQWDENELAEPSTTTSRDGSFSISLADYDFDGDGLVTTTDGRFVMQGGVDISTGLGWPIPLVAPVGIFSLTPVSTLVESLVRTQDLSLGQAIERATAGLGLTGYDLTSGASIYQVLSNDGGAARAYLAHVQLYAAALGLANYLAGVSGRDVQDLGIQVFDSVAALINSASAELDLTQPSIVQAVGQLVVDRQAIVLDNDSDLTRISTIIALGIQKLADVQLVSDASDAGQQFLLHINRIKKIVQGQLPLALLAAGSGDVQLEDLEAEYSSTGFDTKIAASVATVTVPPVAAINSAELRESNFGTSVMTFSVSLVGSHDYPVSLAYATQDINALAGTDYVASSGTLTWTSGDNSVKTIAITINGDTAIESDEQFRILLSQPDGLVIRIGEGQGTVANDDTVPVAITSENNENELYVLTSDSSLDLIVNGVPTQTGNFSQGTALFITGQPDKSDSLTIDFSANTYRADQISFNGGAGTTPDRFKALAGVFDTLTYRISGATDGNLEFTPADPAQRSVSALNQVEAIDFSVSSVKKLVIHIPSSVSQVTIEDTAGGRKRLRSNNSAFIPLEFDTPSEELSLVRASTATVITVNSTDAQLISKIQYRYADATKPISSLAPLPQQSTSLSINLAFTGTDPNGPEGVATGIQEFDLYVSTGSAFNYHATIPAQSPAYVFTGVANTTYWFRTIARDNAGNVEIKGVNDAFTRILDITPPTSNVTSATLQSGNAGLFQVQLSGEKVSGSPLSQFDVYVSVDNGAYALAGIASAVRSSGNSYTGSLVYQGIADGASHTYKFYSRARDGQNNLEAAPSIQDVTVTATIAPSLLTATAIDVQNGSSQRSYIRNLDVLFSSASGVSALANANRVKLERFDIAATSVSGQGTEVPAPAFAVSGNKLSLDFGSTGLGGLRQAGNGFYRVRIDVDGNGSFADAADKVFEFYRLFGDANGDGTVNDTDINLITSQVGRSGSNLSGDIDGNGTVNSLDRTYATQQRGKSLQPYMFGLLDD